MRNQKSLKIILKGMVVINNLALLMVINNVNVTCAWIWGQPKISEKVKSKYRKK